MRAPSCGDITKFDHFLFPAGGAKPNLWVSRDHEGADLVKTHVTREPRWFSKTLEQIRKRFLF